MAEYRTISTRLWTSPYIEDLTPEEKLFYIYLFSSPHTNNAGVLYISPRKMAFETGIPHVERILDRLKSDRKIVEVDGYYWIVNFIDHQTSHSPKIAQSIGKALEQAPRELAAQVLEKYRSLSIPYRYPTDTVPIPYAEREEEREEEMEEEPLGESVETSEKEPERKSASTLPKKFLASPFREESERFAEWFANELKPPSISGTKTELEQWAMVWYHLRETDGRDNGGEMAEAVAWARGDPFWSKNFVSPLKLRSRDKQGQMYIDRFIAEYRNSKTGGRNGGLRRGITPDQLQGIFDWIDNNPAIPP
ncbi:MAG: hypothetical protein HGB04_06690 [Chlorobiaceae bacterium]|nr:hypothetical protein [Chlorobiaceae bacterium]